jgi:hypothetical protein
VARLSQETRTVAEIGDEHLRIRLRAAPPLTLHGDYCWRTDGNSPMLSEDGEAILFFSHYEPRGHTLRRRSRLDLRTMGAAMPVELLDDPDPQTGKWIEAVWREPSGLLRGWYHGERRAPCDRRIYIPHIGELVSEDDGRRWHCRGEVLRTTLFDCSWQNGFFAGGYGDFCVVPDCKGERLFLFFTSYHTDERAQGIALARMPAKEPSLLELWSEAGWQLAKDLAPTPLWPIERGWRHADPASFWGPAVHFNHALQRYVMLLNRTKGGAGDLRQEGVYISTSADLENPKGWSVPLQLVKGGAWYPQVISLEPGGGDTCAGGIARFFMAGFSAWEIEFAASAGPRTWQPLKPTAEDFVQAFGDRRCPW